MAKSPTPYRLQLCNSHRPKIAGEGCCNDRGSLLVLAEFQAYIKAHQLEDQIEIVETACLRNCKLGISLRVIPDMTLYGKVKVQDIEEIVQEHLIKGKVVKRLEIEQNSIFDQF